MKPTLQKIEEFIVGWDARNYDVSSNHETIEDLAASFPYKGIGFRGTNSLQKHLPPLSWCKSLDALIEFWTNNGIASKKLPVFQATITGIDLTSVCALYLRHAKNKKNVRSAKRMMGFEEVLTLDWNHMLSVDRIGVLFERKPFDVRFVKNEQGTQNEGLILSIQQLRAVINEALTKMVKPIDVNKKIFYPLGETDRSISQGWCKLWAYYAYLLIPGVQLYSDQNDDHVFIKIGDAYYDSTATGGVKDPARLWTFFNDSSYKGFKKITIKQLMKMWPSLHKKAIQLATIAQEQNQSKLLNDLLMTLNTKKP